MGIVVMELTSGGGRGVMDPFTLLMLENAAI